MQKVFTVFSLVFLLFSIGAAAQNYKWVKGGGGISTITSSYDDEASYHLTTDKHGNVYSLNIVGSDMVAADTFSYANFGAQNNVLITSYNCDGQMRWAKFIKATPSSTKGIGIKVDTMGNLYVAVRKSSGVLYIDNDTIINMNQLYTALVQFDTNGHYNWVRFLGTNNASNSATYANYGVLALSGQSVHLLSFVGNGAQLNTSIVSEKGVYDHIYDASGNLLDIIRLDMDSSWVLMSAAIEANSGKIFITGHRDLSLPNYQAYAACFNFDGTSNWFNLISVTSNGAFTNVEVDKSGESIYFCGSASQPITYNGQTISNLNFGNFFAFTFVIKADMSGDVLWKNIYSGNSGVNGLVDLTMLGNDKIVACGTLAGKNIIGTDTLTITTGEGQNGFYTIIDTTGNLLKLEQLHGIGFYDRANAVADDKNGNLYIGGKVEQNIWGGSLTPYVTNGGNSDFYVMKYGFNCDCVPPDASYTFSVNTLTGNFTFNGSALIDSLVWNFGDGNSQTTTGTTVSHTYPNDDSTYTVCVTIYNECGNTTYCDTVHISAVSVSNIAAFPGVQVYPNPSEEYMIVEGAEGMNAALFSITGQQVYRGVVQSNKHSINTSDLSAGTYLLQLTANDGRKMSMTVVKR